ncbi:MAG TPA: IS1595 family transposase [Terracidiphilus sp.]|nr:IS1595 family transposase [Terracidiphilus sp.]
MNSKKPPKTLLAATRYFADPDVCIDFVAAMRWPDGVECPACLGKKVSYLSTRRIWKCMTKKCHKQFSVKTNSVFEDSPIPLDKWLTAIWLVVNCKNGVSSYEIHRGVGVTQKTAWFMLHRIRRALKSGFWRKLGGEGSGAVEVDECFIGPTPQKMHRDKRLAMQNGLHARQKTPVMGMLDRDARQVRAAVVPNVKRETLQNAILEQIEKGSTIYTDNAPVYDNLKTQEYIHEAVNHVEEYVRGNIHTQGIENFWSLLKRGLKGTYVAVEPFHLDRYLDEQVFRFNNRATKDNPLTDLDRFLLAVSQIAGKRLTYAELTGKVPGSDVF